MIARVLRVDVQPEQVDNILRTYREDVRPIHATAAGLRQHYVLVDRAAGHIEIIGIWESARSVADIAPILEPVRRRLWSQFASSPPLDVYEVADQLR